MKCGDCALYVSQGTHQGECHLDPPKFIDSHLAEAEQASSYRFIAVYEDSFCSNFQEKMVVEIGSRRRKGKGQGKSNGN